MSVFRNYDANQAGRVNANALPRVYSIPWVPTQQNVRSNPNIPTQPQRIQPHERGTFFGTSATGQGTLAPSMGSGGGCGCGGGNGAVAASVTASSMSTSHSFHGSSGKHPPARIIMAPRLQPRSTGALRPTLSSAGRRPFLTPFFGGRGTR